VLDRAALLERFTRNRARTRELFGLIDDEVYYTRPIPLRNPVVFYEGHLPAFAVNTLIKKALGRPGVDEQLEQIFARGIDPDTEATAVARGNPAWPSRQRVLEYAAAADAAIELAIRDAELERDRQPLLHRGHALWAILEHEEMHQETLAYMWHQLPYSSKRKPAHYVTAPPRLRETFGRVARVRVPAGTVTLGTHPRDAAFAWDNELPAQCAVVESFDIDVHNVTNAAFKAFVDAGGYTDARWWRPEDWDWIAAEHVTHPPFWEKADGRWGWRGMFERVALPDDWPVYVTWAEARAYALWNGARLPTEAEFHRAAFGTLGGNERQFPWGEQLCLPAGSTRPPANFDFARWDPEPIGAHPDGASAFGVHDLVGNGWEWTSTIFAPFNGFEPSAAYPEYSADFFDDKHFVLKGASPVTARTLVRRGFRNWFRPTYPYVYASFRCVANV
jgi:ergothioneine biosynthesis protein EgtB